MSSFTNSTDTSTVSSMTTEDISSLETTLNMTTEEMSSLETTLNMTTATTTEPVSANVTIFSDNGKDTSILLYIAVPVVVLSLIELVIFVVIIRRCCTKYKKDLSHYTRTEFDEDAERFPVFSVVNKAYTGYVPDEKCNDNMIKEERPKTNDVNKAEDKKRAKRNLDYVDIDLETPAETKEPENGHRKTNNVFFNRAYSHIEIFPPLQSDTTASNNAYAHVDLGDGGDTYNRLHMRRHSDFIRRNSNTDFDDVEYDHAITIRNRNKLAEDDNYSRLELWPKTTISTGEKPDGRRDEEPHKIYEFVQLPPPCKVNKNGKEDLHETPKLTVQHPTQQTPMSSKKDDEPYIYSIVRKGTAKERINRARAKTVCAVTREFEVDESMSQNTRPEKKYQSLHTKSPSPVIKALPRDDKTGGRYEYSQVVKKKQTKSPGKSASDDGGKTRFCVLENDVSDGPGKNQRNTEYINVTITN